jgi:hypothetical protein
LFTPFIFVEFFSELLKFFKSLKWGNFALIEVCNDDYVYVSAFTACWFYCGTSPIAPLKEGCDNDILQFFIRIKPFPEECMADFLNLSFERRLSGFWKKKISEIGINAHS